MKLTLLWLTSDVALPLTLAKQQSFNSVGVSSEQLVDELKEVMRAINSDRFEAKDKQKEGVAVSRKMGRREEYPIRVLPSGETDCHDTDMTSQGRLHSKPTTSQPYLSLFTHPNP